MRRRGARPGDLVALLAATGAQTGTVPSSLVLVTIGSVTNVSITALFTDGLLPSALLAIMLCIVVRFRHRDPGATAQIRGQRRQLAAEGEGGGLGATEQAVLENTVPAGDQGQVPACGAAALARSERMSPSRVSSQDLAVRWAMVSRLL